MSKKRTSISFAYSYLLVGICFLALSVNLLSFNVKESVEESGKHKKEQSQHNSDDTNEELSYCAYEALIPSVHFAPLFQFSLIIDIGIIESPVQIIKSSLPLFTRPYYRTLFRMIIAPNAP